MFSRFGVEILWSFSLYYSKREMGSPYSIKIINLFFRGLGLGFNDINMFGAPQIVRVTNVPLSFVKFNSLF